MEVGIADLFVLIFSLALISIYGLWKSREQEKSSRERMVGSGMSVWSVTLSVCSGFISSISLLGFPAEIYLYGSMFIWMMLTYFIAFPIVAYVFLPVIYNLKLGTLYEYFERRFDVDCRIVAVSIFVIQTLLYNAVALYAPSLAISSLTGISLTISIITTALLSAIYISVGGAKAGVHTSALQMGLIFFTMGFIVLLNLWDNPLSSVMKTAYEGYRLSVFDFRPDPRIRHSVWSLVFGGGGNILCLFAANQLSIQRYIAMPTLKQAQRVVLLNIVCNSAILVMYILIGLLVYHRYSDCDPKLKTANELLPRFVLDSVSHIPGIVGLFAAAVYSAGISTLSASFTAVSTVIVQDAWKIRREMKGKDLKEDMAIKLSRFLPISLAIFTIGMAYACSYLKNIILQIAFSVFGAVGGPVLGSFVVGMFMPKIRGRAGVFGLIGSFICCLAVAMGALYNEVRPVRLPLGTCSSNHTVLVPLNMGLVEPLASDSIFTNLTKISYQYYSLIGVITNILFAIVYQLIFGQKCSQNCPVPQELLSPLVRAKGHVGQVPEPSATEIPLL